MASSTRAYSQERLSLAEEKTNLGWRSLAQAGLPRTPRDRRGKAVAAAARHFDGSRAALTEARWTFQRFRQSDEAKSPGGKAGVSMLEPRLKAAAADLAALGEALRAHRPNPERPLRSLEVEQAQRYGWPLFGNPRPLRRCHWCGEAERPICEHYSLDGEGYPVQRGDLAKRFICPSCFRGGKDLAEPAPKPLPEGDEVRPTEVVSCEVVSPPPLACPPLALSSGREAS